MPKSFFLGEFEQLVLLALLRLGNHGYALDLREELTAIAERRVSRGALYRTLDRLEGKGYVEWELESAAEGRGGHVRRHYAVTAAGIEVVKAVRSKLTGLWRDLETELR